MEGVGIRSATLNGSYVPKKNFDGTITYVNGEADSFTSTYDGDSKSAPNLTLVTGTYSGIRTDNHTVTVTVDAAETLSCHSSDGCTFTGTFSPLAKGTVLHTSMTLEGSACSTGNETLTGVTVFDAATNRLYIAALNHTRTTSFLFLDTKR